MNEKYLTVSALTRYIKAKIDTDEHLKYVFLKGEISNFKNHTSGHMYFSLKDESSKINAIMFSKDAKNLQFKPVDGMHVLVVGRISVYEATGNYQIYIESMLDDGLGNLYASFEKLKSELSKEGLFDEIHKKSLPKYPKKVGIVTAATGAAIKDILSTINRRYPVCETYLFPSLVQGENAALDIVKNIKLASTFDLDVLIIGRGGGSIEDLWPFNEEIVARSIFESKIPIISAVGHEIDFTIADFVADLRAPTPTSAAEFAVPNIIDVISHINQLKIRLNEGIYKKLNYSKLHLDAIKNSYVIKSPIVMFENKKQKLSIMTDKISMLIKNIISNKKTVINNLKDSYIIVNPKELYLKKQMNYISILEKLELVNPLKVLKRGYSVVYQNENIIANIKLINKELPIKIKMHNGILNAKINEVNVDD